MLFKVYFLKRHPGIRLEFSYRQQWRNGSREKRGTTTRVPQTEELDLEASGSYTADFSRPNCRSLADPDPVMSSIVPSLQI
jgi:hypothetical protein